MGRLREDEGHQNDTIEPEISWREVAEDRNRWQNYCI